MSIHVLGVPPKVFSAKWAVKEARKSGIHAQQASNMAMAVRKIFIFHIGLHKRKRVMNRLPNVIYQPIAWGFSTQVTIRDSYRIDSLLTHRRCRDLFKIYDVIVAIPHIFSLLCFKNDELLVTNSTISSKTRLSVILHKVKIYTLKNLIFRDTVIVDFS